MFIPILAAILPGLIQIAESKFLKPESGSGAGSQKKQWVLDIVGKIYDLVGLQRIIPDIPGVDERAFFIDVAGFLIEKLVPQLTK